MTYQFLDILKSSDNHNKWEEVTGLLTSYSKDPSEVVNSISQSLLHLNSYSTKFRRPIPRNNKEKSIKYIKLICKLKNLVYSDTSRNGLNCLELSCDCFRIIIVLNDIRTIQNDSNFCIYKQILFEYNKEKPVSCPELLKALSDGCYEQLITHIYELQTLYSVGHDKQEQLKAFLCLQSLEEDINKLSKCPISVNNAGSDFLPLIPQPNNLIGIVKSRSGGIPAQFVFYCPLGGKPGENADPSVNASDRFRITLQLMDHHEKNLLPFIPLVNLQKDSNGNCIPSFVTADTIKCVPLAAKFVLRLSQPLIMTDSNISSILFVTGLEVITTGTRTNYVDLLLLHNGSSLVNKDQFYSILPNNNQLIFQLSYDEMNSNAQTVTSIPFLLPSQLPRIIAILKKQAVINCMMESFLLSNLKTSFIKDTKNAQIVNVSVLHDHFTFSYNRRQFKGKFIKFSIAFNYFSQISVKFLSCDGILGEGETLAKFQHIVHKYNNIPMIIFWLLHKLHNPLALESISPCLNTPLMDDSPVSSETYVSKLSDDHRFINNCLAMAKNNLSINSHYHKDMFPKIKIEPKLELMTTTSQQIVNSFSTVVHDSSCSINKSKPMITISHSSDQLQSIQSIPMANNCPPIEGSNQLISITNNGAVPSNASAIIPPTSIHKSESIVPPFSTYGSKHMSLDQMLSSDFALPFSSEGYGPMNTSSHSMHYPDHSQHQASMSTGANNYSNHHYNMGPQQNKESNSKMVGGRLFDTQSSVLVNLLNCNESQASNNSGAFMNRQLPRTMPNQTQMVDQFDSPSMHSHLTRIPQIPRLRMPHPNPSKSNSMPPSSRTAPATTVSVSPPAKPDVMMMPYPQDTGDGRAMVSRKPRKKKLSSSQLEMNQRLPKQPMMQPPSMRQPMHHHDHHTSIHSSISPIAHPVQQHGSIAMATMQQPHQQAAMSASNFSSPNTSTMDQSIYDFDDNTDCGRSRINTGSVVAGGHVGMSSMQPGNANFNNPSGPNRKLANAAASKKPLKVKISRKNIAAQEFKSGFPTSEQQPDGKMGKDKPSKTNPAASPFNVMRSTAIMNAIDSPLTCSSLSSIQTSPHGSVSVTCAQMSSLDPGVGSINDPSLLKKRRKRRIKSDLDESTPESIKKKEKLEMRKQNRKKKEMLLINGGGPMGSMGSSGASGNGSSSMDMMMMSGSSGADVSIKAPLPIKLSLNAKTGSVSGGSGNAANMLSMAKNAAISAGPPGNRSNSKVPPPMSSSQLSSEGANNWMMNNQVSGPGGSGASMKQSMSSSKQQLESKHHSSTSALAEPLLKNYKIPKKKSSDIPQLPVPFSDGAKVLSSAPNFPKTSSTSLSNDPSKPHRDQTTSDHDPSMTTLDSCKPKTPIMLHPDAAVSLASSQMAMVDHHHQELKHSVGQSMDSMSTPIKAKNLHAIVDTLRARSGSASTSGNNHDTMPVGACSSMGDFSSSSKPLVSTAANLDNNQTSSENIFEKFSSSKNNGKSDHRQFTNNRFPDSSNMNMQRYPYNRPPAGFSAPKLRPPVGAPISYAVPRQPYMNNPNSYRMDSAPVNRNFAPVHQSNIPYGPKKTPNNNANFTPKKK